MVIESPLQQPEPAVGYERWRNEASQLSRQLISIQGAARSLRDAAARLGSISIHPET